MSGHRDAVWWAGLVVAAAAAVATAHGLYAVADASGVPQPIAGLYPVMTDGLALVAYTATNRLTGAGRRYAWTVVVAAAGSSGAAQAVYLAGGGLNSASTPVRFAIGAAPAVAAAALLVVPGTAYEVDQMRDAIRRGFQPHFLEAGEHDALRHLDAAPDGGGVLAPVYSGLLVPAYTGRETWVGAGSWTPDFEHRRLAAERLFAGRMDRAAAAALVRRSGARFLLSDCHGRADIAGLVADVAGPPRRFACATVYRVRRP